MVDKTSIPESVTIILVLTFVHSLSRWGIRTAESVRLGDAGTDMVVCLGVIRTLGPLLAALFADLRYGTWKVVIVGAVVNCATTTPLLVAQAVFPHLYPLHIAYLVVDTLTAFNEWAFEAFLGRLFFSVSTELVRTSFTFYYYLSNLALLLGVLGAFLALLRKLSMMVYLLNAALGLSLPVFLVLFRRWFSFHVHRSIHFRDLFLCPMEAHRNRKNHRSSTATFWIDYAIEKYPDDGPRRDVGQLISLLPFVVVTFVFFYARNTAEGVLADQVERSGLVAEYEVWPIHVTCVKSAVVIMLLPALEVAAYPLAKTVDMLNTPMKRICSGCAVFAIMYFVAGTIQNSLPPKRHLSHLINANSTFHEVSLAEFIQPNSSEILMIIFQLMLYSFGDLLHTVGFMMWVYSEAPPGLRATSIGLVYAMSPLADIFIFLLPVLTPSLPDDNIYFLGSMMIAVFTAYVLIIVSYKKQSINT